MLAVYAPLIGGRNVNPWPRLTNFSHLGEWCQEISLSKNIKTWNLRATHHGPLHHQPSDDFAYLCTLGHSIIEGDAKWDGDLRFIGEFRYSKGYWEWTEDVLSRCGDRLFVQLKVVESWSFTERFQSIRVGRGSSGNLPKGVLANRPKFIVKAFCEAWCPLTNSLLTSIGEISILLWDLRELAGIPVTGCLYDEVVPSALGLTGIDEKRERFIPRSSKYLFYAYHLLQSVDDNRCSHKKTVRPKSTHNPLGDIAIHERWSTVEGALFAKLCIERSLKEEVYLAAYLACWLCMFVLPGKYVNSIHPSTFKMASLMMNGRRVNLAIPVLASIYKGLNTVVISPKPTGTSHPFPIHFVYAWLACYFKTHYSVWQELRGPKMTGFSGEGGAKYYESREARKRIHKAEFISWVCNILVKDGPLKFVDDGHAEEVDHNYFIAIRLSYLTLHQGGRFIIKPYSPHRFGRQFGLHEKQLKEAKARLQDVQAKVSKEASEIQSAIDELEHIEKDIVVLKGQRTSLRATLKGKKQLNHDTQAKVHEVEKDIAILESTGPLDDAIVENLESSRASLEILKGDLKSLNSFA
ncbi:hypothetical protein Sango_2099400 [Sesamum angolense]|uniref:Aminotransferase-like plant mobile domain-containing protein n=1 Tax=Sesamum angolense TaxID=2727404 RepID=A0AAE1WBX7_9LAMI|nr:hypothetical protein Sango_2099400 [Sesamum angolense]